MTKQLFEEKTMNDDNDLQMEIINTRLSSDIELKMALPWVGFTEEELKQLRREHHLYIPTIKKIEKMLMDKNGYEF